MARRVAVQRGAAERGRLTVSQQTFAFELSERIERGKELLEREIPTPDELKAARADYYTWSEFNVQLLKRRFTTDELATDYSGGGFFFGGGATTFFQDVEEYRDDVRTKVRRLNSILEQVPLYEGTAESPPATAKSRSLEIDQMSKGGPIFLVHGHAEGPKREIAAFLTAVTGSAPIVLHERPSEGRTIIEKLEYFGGQAGCAIVILTADDEGRERGSESTLRWRGRQNVVLELGFFIGALGRARVALLYESDVELPSDMKGVLYVRLDDAGGWKMILARELKAAGLPADLNAAI
jgi:predicted nucleotide-binding protein